MKIYKERIYKPIIELTVNNPNKLIEVKTTQERYTLEKVIIQNYKK
tara:strand:- start:72 stop:209 length:138 start_codon:yes stop_codon:yes gene_type:complete